MPVQFDGQNIFGAITRQVSLRPRHRMQEESIPGIAGARLYDLGGDGAEWGIRGRIVATGISYAAALASLVDTLMAAASYHNAGMYDFTDAGGNTYNNCALTSYQQAGEFQTCDYNGLPACTVVVNGTVRWMLPE